MTRIGDAAYRLLLGAFPPGFRARYGESMLAQFKSRRRALEGRPIALAGLWIRGAADALWNGLAARRAASTRPGRSTSAFMSDLRDAARALRRGPGVTVMVVVMLTAGISASALMFGIVDQLLLRAPVGVSDPDTLRRLYFGTERPVPSGVRRSGDRHSYPFVAAVRDRTDALQLSAVTHVAEVTVGGGSDAAVASAQLVDPAYFRVLGVQPMLGGFFEAAAPDEAPQVAVLSHAIWRTRFAAAPDVIGQTLRVEGQPLTIVGVTPAGFKGVEREPVDLWVPLKTLAPAVFWEEWRTRPGYFAFSLIGRVTPGVASASADAQAKAAIRSVAAELPTADSLATAFFVPLRGLSDPNGIAPAGRVGLWLLGVSGVVLLVAVANVAGLLLTRAISRRREMGVRLALGISRTRLVRLHLVESTLLAAISVVGSVLLTYGAAELVQRLVLPSFAWSDDLVDVRVLTLAMGAGVLTALAAGLAPSVQAAGTNLMSSLRPAPQSTTGRTGWLRVGLMFAQVTLCVLLLVGAGLFVRSLLAVRGLDVGLDLHKVVLARLPDRSILPLTQLNAVYERAVAEVSSVAGVERAVISRSAAPMTLSSSVTILPDGWKVGDAQGRGMPMLSAVPADYFATIGATLKRGRSYTADDERRGGFVAVINESLAREFWPDADPIGQCLHVGGSSGPCTTVLGVVENVMHFDRTTNEQTHVYLPPTHPHADDARPRALLIRTVAEAAPIVPRIRKTLQALTADMPYVTVATLEELTAPQLQPWRLGSTMFLVFGGVALVIAAAGLYSVMAHAVSQRSQEIGIRMALGASRWHVVAQVARHGALIVIVGTACGLVLAAAGSTRLTDLLYQTSARDPLVYLGVAGVLVLAGLAAAIVPARRSAAVDPLVVLKSE